MRVALFVVAVLALAAVVSAGDPPKAETTHKHKHAKDDYSPPASYRKVILQVVSAPIDKGNYTDVVGDTEVLVRYLGFETSGPVVAKLYQTGIVADPDWELDGFKQGLTNYQGTIIFSDNEELREYGFLPGAIFYVGYGTGYGQTFSTYLPKSIVGGDGPYDNARGKIFRTPPGAPPSSNPGPYTIMLW